MWNWMKGGLFGIAAGFMLAPAAYAMDPAVMMMQPSDPLFDGMVLLEIERLSQELQALTAKAMASSDPEVKKQAWEAYTMAQKMEEMIGELRRRTLEAEANSQR